MNASMKPATYGRGLYVAVLAFVSLLSVAGNAVYAYSTPAAAESSLSPGWAAAAHMLPPIVLLLITEVLAMASAHFTGRGRAAALAGVVVIAMAAFILSFDALYEVAQMARVRPALAPLVPIMLDAAIIVCTVLVLMASRQMQRDRVAEPVAEPVVVAESPTAPEWPITHTAVVDRPVAEPLVVAESPTPTTLVGVGDPSDSPQVTEVVAAEITQSTPGPAVGDHPVVEPVVAAESPTAPTVDEWAIDDGIAHSDGGGSAMESPTAQPVVDEESPTPSTTTTTPVVVAESPTTTTAVAAWVHAESGTTKPMEAVEAVLLLAEAGESQRAIAAEIGVDRSLVRRWTQAAEEYRQPQLAAVR